MNAIDMLNENDIIELMAKYLVRKGYIIHQTRSTKERGVDIIAENIKTKQKLYIEAKGETSSVPTSNRYREPFNGKQIYNQIAKAIMASLKTISSQPDDERTKVAIALPFTKGHQKEFKTVKLALKKIGIKIYWVNKNEVKIEED